MAIVESATWRATSRTWVTAGIILTMVAALVALALWGGEAEFPVEFPNVATPAEMAPADLPVAASQSATASSVSSTAPPAPVAVPNVTVSGNGDGRTMIQFEGLRPGVTAE